jgi:hypothetical protein
VIEVGYITKDEAEVVHESGLNAPDANASVAALKEALSFRDDIKTLFLQKSNGDSVNRYGYIEP